MYKTYKKEENKKLYNDKQENNCKMEPFCQNI